MGMNTLPKPTESLTVLGDLNAIPWSDSVGKREFSLQLGLALDDGNLSFPDTLPAKDLPEL
jgi:endonuclease/exonuclease/phosphatase (EEP) superfamily protein YafD